MNKMVPTTLKRKVFCFVELQHVKSSKRKAVAALQRVKVSL
jgi:hypothetical protein